MCRLYAGVDHAASERRRFLLDAPNALLRQSRDHADGWGVADFTPQGIRIERSTGCAWQDDAFPDAVSRASGRVVLAHVRRASVGPVNPANTHPFTDGQLVFAHNGTVPGFDEIRPKLEQQCGAELAATVKGETDSEWLFALLRRHLQEGILHRDSLQGLAAALRATVNDVVRLCGDRAESAGLNLLVSDGTQVVVSCLRRSLFVRRPPTGGFVIASEPDGETFGWHRMGDGSIVATSSTGTVHFGRL